MISIHVLHSVHFTIPTAGLRQVEMYIFNIFPLVVQVEQSILAVALRRTSEQSGFYIKCFNSTQKKFTAVDIMLYKKKAYHNWTWPKIYLHKCQAIFEMSCLTKNKGLHHTWFVHLMTKANLKSFHICDQFQKGIRDIGAIYR